jgi:hypothetical protein
MGLWVFGAGLFFLGVRVIQINPLSFGEPKWLVGSIVAVIFAAARCLDWWRTEYPAELARRVSAETIYPLTDLGSRISGAPARQSLPEAIVRK